MKQKKSDFGLDNINTLRKRVREEGTMLGKMRKAALIAAMLGAGVGVSDAYAAELPTDKVGNGTYTAAQDYFVHSSNGAAVDEGTTNGNVTVSGNGKIIFGQKDATNASAAAVDWKTGGSLIVGGSGTAGSISLVTSANGVGTKVEFANLGLGTNNVNNKYIIGASDDAVDSQNTLRFGSITNNMAGTLEVGRGSLFEITGDNNTKLGEGINGKTFIIDLKGGTADFSGSGTSVHTMTLAGGEIKGGGTIGGNIDLNKAKNSGDTEGSTITVDSVKQNYLHSVTNTDGAIAVGSNTATGTSEMIVAADLNVKGGTTSVDGTGSRATLDVKKTLNVTQNNNAGSFVIKGKSGSLGTVTANQLVMSENSGTSANRSYINVDAFGKLEVGTTADPKVTDTYSRSIINVTTNGQAIFNNTQSFGNDNTRTATGSNSSITYNGDVGMGTDNVFTAQNGAVVNFNNGVTMGGDNDIIADNGEVNFRNKPLSMQSTDQLYIRNNGVMDYSGVNEDLVLSKGQLVSDYTGTAPTTPVVNKFVIGDKKLVGNTASAVKITGTELRLVANKTGDQLRDYDVGVEGSIDFDSTNDGIFTVRDLNVTSGVDGDLYLNAAATDYMNVTGALRVAADAKANGNANVATTVSGKSYIDGVYLMDGVNNVFKDDIAVTGATGQLGVINGANMTLDKGKTIKVADGATLGSDSSKVLNINAGTGDPIGANILFNGTKGTNKVLGIVNAKTSDVKVNSDLLVDHELNAAYYEQVKGRVTGTPTALITAADDTRRSLITGASSYEISGAFAGGLDVTKGATLLGTGNTITGNGTKSVDLNVDSTSKIDLSTGNMTITDFNKVNVAEGGSILIGYDTTKKEAHKLTLTNPDTNLIANTKTSVQFTDDFIKNYYERGEANNQEIVIDGGKINNGDKGEWTTESVFGKFTLTYNDPDKKGAYVSLYDKRDVNDLGQIQDFLGSQYGYEHLTDTVNGGLSNVAQNILDKSQGVVSNGTDAGNINYSIFESLAKGLSTWSTADGKYSGTIGKDVLSVRNGSTAAAPIYIQHDSVRNVANTLNSRLDAFRAVKECVVNECFASDTALGMADILNERYLNRVWAGALGNWQNASARKGFDGYKYKSAGGIVGYDRAFGPAIAGISFAYIDGNYTDKTFDWNDSKIRQHNVNLYGTYNASSGFFFTAMAGYNYSRNKLAYGSGGNNYAEKYHSHTLYASAKIGYDIMPCDNLSITPSIGANYFYTRSAGHDVNQSGAAIATYGRMRDHQIELPVEVQVAYEIPIGDKGGLTLSATGGYAYNFRDKGIRGDVFLNGLDPASSSSVTAPISSKATGRQQGHHSWYAGAGVKFRYDHWEIGAKYDYVGRNKYNSHQVTGTVGYSF